MFEQAICNSILHDLQEVKVLCWQCDLNYAMYVHQSLQNFVRDAAPYLKLVNTTRWGRIQQLLVSGSVLNVVEGNSWKKVSELEATGSCVL